MFGPALVSVFANAATLQRIVLLVLAGAIPTIVVAAILACLAKRADSVWARIVADLRIAGPALGLLVGALNAFHMGQTTLRVSFEPTAKQLAPGVLEVATLIGAGALVGVVAAIAHFALGLASARNPQG